MEITVIAFGKIADITTQSQWQQTGVTSTDELRALLDQQYPALKDLNFMISVNKRIVHTNTTLSTNAEVALLPPFSGG